MQGLAHWRARDVTMRRNDRLIARIGENSLPIAENDQGKIAGRTVLGLTLFFAGGSDLCLLIEVTQPER